MFWAGDELFKAKRKNPILLWPTLYVCKPYVIRLEEEEESFQQRRFGVRLIHVEGEEFEMLQHQAKRKTLLTTRDVLQPNGYERKFAYAFTHIAQLTPLRKPLV